jgi:hypothetical protein
LIQPQAALFLLASMTLVARSRQDRFNVFGEIDLARGRRRKFNRTEAEFRLPNSHHGEGSDPKINNQPGSHENLICQIATATSTLLPSRLS